MMLDLIPDDANDIITFKGENNIIYITIYYIDS